MVLNWLVLPEGSRSKVGIVTTRKLGSPVVRNRYRRLLREVYRIHQHDLSQPVEIVLVARESIKNCKFSDIERDYLNGLQMAGLLKTGEERINQSN